MEPSETLLYTRFGYRPRTVETGRMHYFNLMLGMDNWRHLTRTIHYHETDSLVICPLFTPHGGRSDFTTQQIDESIAYFSKLGTIAAAASLGYLIRMQPDVAAKQLKWGSPVTDDAERFLVSTGNWDAITGKITVDKALRNFLAPLKAAHIPMLEDRLRLSVFREN